MLSHRFSKTIAKSYFPLSKALVTMPLLAFVIMIKKYKAYSIGLGVGAMYSGIGTNLVLTLINMVWAFMSA